MSKEEFKNSLEDIGKELAERADSWLKKRKPYTDTWVKNYYRYIGRYRPEQLSAMAPIESGGGNTYSTPFEEGGWNRNNWRSTAFVKLPKVKVLGAYSQMIQSALQNKNKIEVGPKAGTGEAEKIAANHMSETINSQLETSLIDEVLKCGVLEQVLYGTTFVQAPVVSRQVNRTWVRNAMKSMMRKLISPQQGDVWEPQIEAKAQPYIYNRNLFEMIPDPFATDIQTCEGIFHRPFIGEYELVELARRPGFDGQVIADILKDGDYKQSNADGTQAKRSARGLSGTKEGYDLIFYAGKLNAKKLSKSGLKQFKDVTGWIEVLAWIINGSGDANPKVVKMVPNPLAKRPFYMAAYEKIPHELLGVGVGENIGEMCDIVNGGVRLFLDAKKMSLPQTVINRAGLPQGTTVVDYSVGKVWVLDGKPSDVFGSFALPDVSAGVIPLIEMMERFLDEISVPAYTTGHATKNMNKTAAGMSMLMNMYTVQMRAALENLNDMLQHIGQAFYDWNMEHNPDPRIKGDFNIRAAGLANLMQKEVMNQQLMQFLTLTTNPAVLMNPVPLKLLRMLGESMGIKDVDSILPTPEQIEQAQKMQQLATLQRVSQPGDGQPGVPGQPGPGGPGGPGMETTVHTKPFVPHGHMEKPKPHGVGI